MSRYNLAFAFNSSYIGKFKVTYNSIVASNADKSFYLRVLYGDFNDEDISDLTRFITERRGKVDFVKQDPSRFSGLPKMAGDENYTAYYKILLPYCLCDLDKVLYLDCDIIVRGDVSPLFESRGKFICAAADHRVNAVRREHIKELTGSDGAVYFNSGVMLFDFTAVDFNSGEFPTAEQLFTYAKSSKDRIIWHDQDILNAFYWDKCAIVGEEFNYHTTYKSVKEFIFRKKNKNAVIIHYANWKPWNSNYIGKYYKLYKRNYKLLKGEKGVDFLKRRNIFAMTKLLFKYIGKR